MAKLKINLMKLFLLHEAETADPFGEWIKSKVMRRIMKGDSKLKEVLRGSEFTLDHVIYAIKQGECLSNPIPGAKSLGPTYLEQTIANIIRDMVTGKEFPINQLNDARRYFGLERLGPKALKKEKKRATKRQAPPSPGLPSLPAAT